MADGWDVGPGGLAALKSLREEGFHVTGFERRSEPGGVWSFTYDPSITSVTKYTSAQLSKFAVSLLQSVVGRTT